MKNKILLIALLVVLFAGCKNEEPEAELGDVLDRVYTLAMGYRGTLRKAALAISILWMSRKVNQTEAVDVKKSFEHIMDSCTESRYINKRIYAEINEDISPETADLLPWIAFRLLYLANEDCATQKPDSKGIKHLFIDGTGIFTQNTADWVPTE